MIERELNDFQETGAKNVTMTVPFIVTLTPDARNNPPKRLLKI